MSNNDNEEFIQLLKSSVNENSLNVIPNEDLSAILHRARSIAAYSKILDTELSQAINTLVEEIKNRVLAKEKKILNIFNDTNCNKKETVSKVEKKSPKLSIDVIFNNPFRILGLPVNVTEREIVKQAAYLQKCAATMGKVPKVKVDVPCFPACERTSELIEEAMKMIDRSENRFLYSFFWYTNKGSVNQLALDVLSEGNTEKAIDLWEKALSKYLVDLNNLQTSIQPKEEELCEAIVDNYLIPYLIDNYEIDQTLSDIFKGSALRDVLRPFAADILEQHLGSDDDCYHAVSDGPIGTDDNNEEIELDVEIEKTFLDPIISEYSDKILALPEKDFTCAKNLMVLYLGLALKENELNIQYFSKALHLSGRIFHSREALSQYASLIGGTNHRHENDIGIAKFFIDEIVQCFKPLLDNSISSEPLKGIAKSFDYFPDALRKEAIAKLTNRPIQNIRNKVAETAGKRKKKPLEANRHGKELYTNAYDTLTTLKDILSANSLQYQNISDAVSDEIVSCSIDYFNKNKETESNIDPGDDALNLARCAASLACDTRIKDRIRQGMPILEEWVKEKPVRQRRNMAAPHIDCIVKQLNRLPDPDKVFPNELIIADEFLETCKLNLRSLKNTLSLKSMFAGTELNIIPSIIILEQFEDNENKWPEKDDADWINKIDDGKYILQNKSEKISYWSWGVNHIDFNKFYNFTLECSITKIKGTDNRGFGIVWSYKKKDDTIHYFKFGISGNGHYYFKEYNQGWVGGFQWTESEHVVCGNVTNVLTVRKNGNLVTFYINDKLIVSGEKIPGENMIGNGIGFFVDLDITIGVNYLYFCNVCVADFSIIFDCNYYMSLSSAVARRALDFCIAHANRTHDMEKPIMLLNKIEQVDMVQELRKRFGDNEKILKSNLRIKEANTPPLVKLFKKVSKWL